MFVFLYLITGINTFESEATLDCNRKILEIVSQPHPYYKEIPLGFINGEIEIMTTNNLLLTESTLNSITVHCDKYVFFAI